MPAGLHPVLCSIIMDDLCVAQGCAAYVCRHDSLGAFYPLYPAHVQLSLPGIVGLQTPVFPSINLAWSACLSRLTCYFLTRSLAHSLIHLPAHLFTQSLFH